jgi:hypothetical protein
MKRRHLPLLICVALCLSACNESPPVESCDQISQLSLRAILPLAIADDDMPGLVSEKFGVSESDVLVRPAAEGSDVRWTSSGVTYELLVKSGRITLARVSHKSAAPSGDMVLRCLGNPDEYWAYYYPMPTFTRRIAQLNLFYPAIGAACWITKYGSGDTPPSFGPYDTIAACDFVPVDPAEQVLPLLLSDLLGPTARDYIEQQLKPWPGNWQGINVETKPLP